MALFGRLHDDVFMIFSGANRRLYEEALVRVYERFFARGLAFPLRGEIVHEIYEVLRANSALWHEGEAEPLHDLPDLVSRGRRRIRRLRRKPETTAVADEALQRARHIYVRLVQCGWLEEEEIGLRTTVDMPTGPMLLIEQLARLRGDLASRLGGVVAQIRSTLQALGHSPGEAALGLRQARENAEAFVRSLRAILSSLKQIQRDLLGSASLEARLATFFEDFIERLLLRDFEAIHTTNHPYRHRDEILRTAQGLTHDPLALDAIGRVYAEAGLAPSPREGALEAESDLLSVAEVFSAIGEMFERINLFRKQLEARLKNTVRYAERGRHSFAGRAQALLLRLDRINETRPDAARERFPEGLLEPISAAWAEHLQARPREAREPLAPPHLRPRIADPAFALMKRLRREHAARLSPPPAALLRFLERRVAPHGRTEARWLRLETIDDFIAFDAIRRLAQAPHPAIAAHFAIERLGPEAPPHDSEWTRCPNFAVTRLDDHVTLPFADAE
jgi:hypothetical protein